MPEFDHAKRRISAAHVTDELQLGLRVLIRMAVRASALAGQGCRTSIPTLSPVVNVRPAFVVLPAGARDAIFLFVKLLMGNSTLTHEALFLIPFFRLSKMYYSSTTAGL